MTTRVLVLRLHEGAIVHEIVNAGGESRKDHGPEACSLDPGPEPQHAPGHGAAVDRVVDI